MEPRLDGGGYCLIPTMEPLSASAIEIVVTALVLPIALSLFGARWRFNDVAVAAIAAGLLGLIPAIGGALGMIAMASWLQWRSEAPLVPDIVLCVVAARLATALALLPLSSGVSTP